MRAVPVVATSWATPREPLPQDPDGSGKTRVKPGRIPVHAGGIGVPTALALQPRKQHAEPQRPGLFTPRRAARERGPSLLARGAAFARRWPRPLLAPLARQPETRAPGGRGGGLAPAWQPPGLVPGQPQAAWPAALAPPCVASCSVFLRCAGAPRIVCRAAQARFPVPVPLDHGLTPPLACIVSRDSGQAGGNPAPWRAARRRRPHGAVRVEPPCRAPRLAQPSPGAVSKALRQPPEEPRRGAGGADPGEVRLAPPVVSAPWPRARPGVDRLTGPHRWPRALATAQEGLRVDGRAEPRERQWPQRILHHWPPPWPDWPPPLRPRGSSDACGTGALALETLPQGLEVVLQVVRVRWGTPPVHAGGRVLLERSPPVSPHVGMAPPREGPTPRRRLALRLLCSAWQGGGHGGPPLPVRAMFPVPAP